MSSYVGISSVFLVFVSCWELCYLKQYLRFENWNSKSAIQQSRRGVFDSYPTVQLNSHSDVTTPHKRYLRFKFSNTQSCGV